MTDEKVITLTEFRVVSENIASQFKKIIEVMNQRFEKADAKSDVLQE